MVYVFALIKAYIVNLTYVTMHKQIKHTEKHMTNHFNDTRYKILIR